MQLPRNCSLRSLEIWLLRPPNTFLVSSITVCDFIYRLDTETKGSTRFRNPRALGCSVPSAARALLRARGFLNRVDPIGLSV